MTYCFGWLFLAWMSETQAFKHAQEQSGVLGEEIAGKQGQGQIRYTRIEKNGLASDPRVGT